MKIIVFFVLQEIFLNLIKSVETLHRYVSNEYLWSMITKRRTSQKCCIVQLIAFNWQNQILNALEYYINLLQSIHHILVIFLHIFLLLITRKIPTKQREIPNFVENVSQSASFASLMLRFHAENRELF